ncbi:uncharacterized protein [Centruroides vittatus]|uniref:uncharacterized protein n=1 Tax=Centruroides vittatus TaxID=120091 RepID=UPI00350EE123
MNQLVKESKISQYRMKEISALLIQIWWKTKYTNKQIMQIMKYVESQRNPTVSLNILKLKEFIIKNILKIFWRLFSREQKEENENVQKITHDAVIWWEEMLSCKHHGEVFDNLVIIQARLKGLMERIRFVKICKIQENDQITAKINLWWDKLLEHKYRKPIFNSLICVQAFVIGFIKNLQLKKKVNKVEKEMAALNIQKFWKHFQLKKNGCQISVRITLELQNCLHKFKEIQKIDKKFNKSDMTRNTKLIREELRILSSKKLSYGRQRISLEKNELQPYSNSEFKLQVSAFSNQSTPLSLNLQIFKTEYFLLVFESTNNKKNLSNIITSIQTVIRRFITFLKYKKEIYQQNENAQKIIKWWKELTSNLNRSKEKLTYPSQLEKQPRSVKQKIFDIDGSQTDNKKQFMKHQSLLLFNGKTFMVVFYK